MPGLDDLDVDAAAQKLASVGGAPIPDVSPVNPPPAPIAGPPAPPADPTLPENQPPPAPATPPAPAPLGDNPVEDFKKTEADRAAAQAEADRAAAKAAEDEAKRKEREAEALRKQQEERDEHEAALNHTRERLAAAADQAEQQVADYQFHDYMSTRTNGQKIMILMGGFLSGLAGNKSNEIIDRAISQDFERQKAELASKENLARLKREGVRDFDGYMRDQRLVLDHKEARAREALAAQMEAEAARSNNPVVAARAQAAAAKMRQAAAEKLGEVEKTYAETQYTNARTKLAVAKAAAARGGGGGALKPGAIADFKRAIVAGTDDGKGGTRPLDAGEIQTLADKLGIPAVAKAGHPSVENLTKDVAFVAGQKAKADAAEQKRADKLDADLQKELYPASGKGPGTQLERIEAMRGELKDAIARGDKTAATRVLEEAGGMLSGGKSTKNTVHLLEQLKSTTDSLASTLGRITGNPGDTQAFTERLDTLLAGAAAEKRAEVDAITKRHQARGKGSGDTGQPSGTSEPAPAAMSPEQITQAKAWLQQNMKDPRAKAVAQKLRALGAI